MKLITAFGVFTWWFSFAYGLVTTQGALGVVLATATAPTMLYALLCVSGL